MYRREINMQIGHGNYFLRQNIFLLPRILFSQDSFFDFLVQLKKTIMKSHFCEAIKLTDLRHSKRVFRVRKNKVKRVNIISEI